MPTFLTATKPLHPSMKPAYNINATHTAKRSLVAMIGQSRFADFVRSNGGFMLANLARIVPAELARLTSGGTPAAASTTAPAAPRQLIRLGSSGTPAAVPTTPTTAPKPSTPSKTHQFIPATPTTPPAKSGARSGALSIDEAEALAGQVFKDYAPALNATETARWKSLESVFAAHGHCAPWQDVKAIAIPWPKLVGHASRTRKIAQVFQTGLTRAEFSKLSARDQSDFCAAGGIITN